MPDLTVRIADRRDAPSLLAVWKTYRDLLVNLDPRLEVNADFRSGESLPTTVTLDYDPKHFPNGHTIRTFVAERDGKVVGFMTLLRNPQPSTGEMWHFVVEPHDGRGGVGTLLFNTAREWFIQHDVTDFIIGVSRNYSVEQAFWRSKNVAVIMDQFHLLIAGVSSESKDITTRLATAQDKATITDVWTRHYNHTMTADPRAKLFIPTPEYFPETVYISEEPPSLMPQAVNLTFVAERDGSVVGVITVGTGNPLRSAYVWHLAVDVTEDLETVGGVLLRDTCQWLRERGTERIIVQVPHAHAGYQAFWRSRGATVMQETLHMVLKGGTP